MTPRLDAIGLVASDLAATLRFYRAAGCDLPDPDVDHDEPLGHVECDLGGGVRLMIDTEEVVRSFDPDWSGSGGGRLGLAVQVDDPADVDALVDVLLGLGGTVKVAPFDAFWGQRYATVLDPDGVGMDVYAAQSTDD